NHEEASGAKELVPQPPVRPCEHSLWWPTDGYAALPDSVVSLLPDRKRQDNARDADVILVSPLGRDVSCTVADLQLDPAKTIAIDPLFCGPAGVTLMVSPATAIGTIEAARAVFAERAIPTFVIADSPGYVAPRVVACIVNLACEMA